MTHYDWSHIQSFVAVAEHGSLSAAARALRGSQPTMSRHIGQLEQEVGARLFVRSKGGMVLTDRGALLMEHAAAMADAAARMSMSADRRDPDLAGTVRLTASQVVATYLLPRILTQFHNKNPNIAIELVASNETDNLLRREADIALRMYRPTQNDVIAQHIGNLGLAAYASPEYVSRRGNLENIDDLHLHDLIGYDRSTLIIDGLRGAGINATRDMFAFRSDDQVVCWEMVRAGFGIGFAQMVIGDADPTVVRVTGPDPVAQMPIWLTAHPELHSTPRIRRVFDDLKTQLTGITERP